MPPQLKRLLPLFAVFIIIFLVIRHFAVPESFGEHGHYRFNSVEENKEELMNYAGKESCTECHDDKTAELASDVHAGLACESCHGPGLAHYDNPDSNRVIVPNERAFCGLCHAINSSRNIKVIVQVDLKDHNPDKKCIECHNPHMPWELKEETTPEESL
jgi:hypothetical protein